MSAQIYSLANVQIEGPAAAEAPPIARDASFEEIEAQGLQSARGISVGVLLSIPAWLILGTFCYFVF